jgi:type III restriction enzyme
VDLWDRIKHKTTYRVQFDNEKLVTECAKALRDCPPIAKTRVQIRKADLAIGRGGVSSEETVVAAPITIEETDIELPDLLTSTSFMIPTPSARLPSNWGRTKP